MAKAEWSPRDRQIVKHIEAIHEAGADTHLFAEALSKVRDDPSLTSAQREAIFKTLAQDYYVFASGKKLDMQELLGDALKGTES